MEQNPDAETLKKLDENLLDHNYDGIQELDNPLPSWWVSLFYATIAFSVVYMILFTFFIPGTGVLADKKMGQLTGKSDQAADAAPLTAGDFPSDAASLEKGRQIYLGKCAACHGNEGQGLVGPNMADAYWIHGKGTEADMYKVVIDGVPEKGMISWKPLMTDQDIRAVVVYLKTLQGTTPGNPKAPQGEKVG